MSYIVVVLFIVVESYLLGSIPCGVIIARLVYGGDPRAGGSGSIGMTNMARLFGIKAAVGTFAGDVGKGALAVAIALLLLNATTLDASWQFDCAIVLALTCSILGHVFSPWLHFKGGKGISTGLGSILVAFPEVALTILAVFALLALATRRVSIGSITAAIAFPIAMWAYHPDAPVAIVFAVIIAVIVCFAHRGNIQRIIAGQEPKFSIHKDKDEEQSQDDKH